MLSSFFCLCYLISCLLEESLRLYSHTSRGYDSNFSLTSGTNGPTVQILSLYSKQVGVHRQITELQFCHKIQMWLNVLIVLGHDT